MQSWRTGTSWHDGKGAQRGRGRTLHVLTSEALPVLQIDVAQPTSCLLGESTRDARAPICLTPHRICIILGST